MFFLSEIRRLFFIEKILHNFFNVRHNNSTAIGFGTGIFGSGNAGSANTEYLRIHIRANSNGGEDQAVKYMVRDAVVEYLTPIAAEAETREEAMNLMNANLSGIERVAESVLREQGFTYGAKAVLKEEEFPTRVYGDYTLEAGVYQALILNLGTGAGDNWWCVIYPPLCFAGQPGENIVYKSKIKEIIDGWKAGR